VCSTWLLMTLNQPRKNLHLVYIEFWIGEARLHNESSDFILLCIVRQCLAVLKLELPTIYRYFHF